MSVTLGEICKFQSGGTPKKRNVEYFGGSIPWITTTALNGGKIDEHNAVDWITEKAIKESAAKIVPAFSIMVGTRVGVGKVAINVVDMSTSQDIISLIDIDEDEWSKDFLCKFIQAKSGYLNLQARGATIKGIKIDVLAALELPIFSMGEQQHISRIIDLVKNMISFRERELIKLDDLIKARFVEMFGNPVTNPKGLPIVALGELSELITKGASPSWQGFSYTDDSSQTIFVTSENVREGYIDLSSPKYIEDGFNEKQKRSVIHKGDFLINIVGASIGRAAQFNLDCKANMNQAAALVRVNDSRVRDKYLLTYLNSDRAQRMYDSMKSDTGRANLSLQDISDLLILLPNVEQQIEFEMFANQVDKSKVAVQKALGETQLLFDSLMQQYFG